MNGFGGSADATTVADGTWPEFGKYGLYGCPVDIKRSNCNFNLIYDINENYSLNWIYFRLILGIVFVQYLLVQPSLVYAILHVDFETKPGKKKNTVFKNTHFIAAKKKYWNRTVLNAIIFKWDWKLEKEREI